MSTATGTGILELLREEVEDIIESTNWEPKGLTPEEFRTLIEVQAMFINTKNKIVERLKVL